jgi:hypothetical protein
MNLSVRETYTLIGTKKTPSLFQVSLRVFDFSRLRNSMSDEEMPSQI